jgi:hypothetical protein
LRYSNTTPGDLSYDTDANPNITSLAGCTLLPGSLPPGVTAQVLKALTTGAYTGSGCTAAGSVGGNHPTLAKGYVTVDVANNCSIKLPTDSSYFTTEMLFDNVLIGDYQQLGPAPVGQTATGFDGAGNPMVHIRAVPEGGQAGVVATNLPFTFYDRYTPTATPKADRRQPLPALWAARYIQSTSAGFATNFKIWREGTAFHAGTSCSTIVAGGSNIPITEIVRFDEHENPFTASGTTICSPCTVSPTGLPEASLTATTDAVYPPSTGMTDAGGWMYLNLNSNSFTGSTTRPAYPGASQNWVIVEMFGQIGANRLSVDFDAAWLGNGCSGAVGTSTANGGQETIGPAGGVLVCPAGGTCPTSDYTGTNQTP